MPPRRRPALLAAGLAGALLCGAACSAGAADREPGDPVTDAEAGVLAGVLAANEEAGGADFVVAAPFAEGSVLTLTGEIDYSDDVGRAQAVTSHGDGRPDDVRTVFFTADALWFGDVPGLAEALTAAELPPATYVRRPAAPVGADASAPLADVLVRLVLNLATAEDDDPAAFRTGDYTWEGQRSIDGRLSSVFASPAGWTVAVDGSSDLLVQYVTELPGQELPVTVSLADHGPRDIPPPPEGETVDGAAHPELLAAVGL
ncbi:hypothetical protein [Trujillonella humicola]|uniref:hypothetical protein n=1 Tax=Trujillonella humicola TaxID=3383699 RepID=UPI003905F912